MFYHRPGRDSDLLRRRERRLCGVSVGCSAVCSSLPTASSLRLVSAPPPPPPSHPQVGLYKRIIFDASRCLSTAPIALLSLPFHSPPKAFASRRLPPEHAEAVPNQRDVQPCLVHRHAASLVARLPADHTAGVRSETLALDPVLVLNPVQIGASRAKPSLLGWQTASESMRYMIVRPCMQA